MTLRAPTPWPVRAATPADHAALQALYLQCLQAADWLPADARHGDLAHDAHGMDLWLAPGAAGQPLGFIGCDTADSLVHHLYVADDARRQGVARALLQAACVPSGRPWRLRCLRANTVALRCYARLGWQPCGNGLDSDGRYLLLQAPSHAVIAPGRGPMPTAPHAAHRVAG